MPALYRRLGVHAALASWFSITSVLPGCVAVTDATDPAHRAIIDGTLTSDHDEVVQIAIYFSFLVKVDCSGTIIADEWVLTTAHCVLEPGYEMVLENSTVRIGPDAGEDEVIEIGVDQVHTHPDYELNEISDYSDWDLAVLHLLDTSPVPPRPINRRAITDGEVGEAFRFVGYGEYQDGEYDDRKRYADLVISSYDEQMIYYGMGSPGTGMGDSGGPALYDSGEGAKVWAVIRGTHGLGGWSTRVDAAAEWLDSITGGDSPPWETDDDASDDDSSAGELDDDDGGDNTGCQCTSTASPQIGASMTSLGLPILWFVYRRGGVDSVPSGGRASSFRRP